MTRRMAEETPRERAARILPVEFLDPSVLAEQGLTRHGIARLVAEGRLVRVRKGRYLEAGVESAVVDAAKLGGRLDCVSLLRSLGIFVHSHSTLHVQFSRGSSRLPPRPRTVTAHWRSSHQGRAALAAELLDAVTQSVRCQHPREAIATLDSVVHHGLLDEAAVAAVFARLPRRYRRLHALLDPRSESGPETIMRLMLRGLGCTVDVQVRIPGVGRVDMVIDGWLIVECDSSAFHAGWEAQRRDRRRDLAAAALGYTTIRPLAEDILYRREELVIAMKAVLSHRSARVACTTPPKSAKHPSADA